jgi:hypothetical protein
MDLLSITPYCFEPMNEEWEEPSDSDSSDEEFEGTEDNSRLGNRDWCECRNCQSMETSKECVCCQDWDVLQNYRRK